MQNEECRNLRRDAAVGIDNQGAKAEDGRQKAEDRRRRTEGRMKNAEI